MAGGCYNKEGDTAEAEAIAELRRRGYVVSVPFGASSVYDLVIEVDAKNSSFVTAQVKSSTNIDDGKVRFWLQRESGNENVSYGDEIDVFILYSVKTDMLFAEHRSNLPQTCVTIDISDEYNSYCLNGNDVSFSDMFPV